MRTTQATVTVIPGHFTDSRLMLLAEFPKVPSKMRPKDRKFDKSKAQAIYHPDPEYPKQVDAAQARGIAQSFASTSKIDESEWLPLIEAAIQGG